MNNELYELFRILVYPFGAAGLLYMGVIIRKAFLSFAALAAYFIMWGGLLVVQAINADSYRYIANLISTPVLGVIVFVIFFNIYQVRKE